MVPVTLDMVTRVGGADGTTIEYYSMCFQADAHLAFIMHSKYKQ